MGAFSIAIGLLLCAAGYIVHRKISSTGADDWGSILKAPALTLSGLALILMPSLADHLVDHDRSPVLAETSDDAVISSCLAAVMPPTDDEYGFGLAMAGTPEDETVTKHSDGTATVNIVRESKLSMPDRCPTRRVASCEMQGTNVIDKTDLHDDGYFVC